MTDKDNFFPKELNDGLYAVSRHTLNLMWSDLKGSNYTIIEKIKNDIENMLNIGDIYKNLYKDLTDDNKKIIKKFLTINGDDKKRILASKI